MPSKKSKNSAKRQVKSKRNPAPNENRNLRLKQRRKSASLARLSMPFRIGITPTGKRRTEAEVKAEVAEALEAARKKLTAEENSARTWRAKGAISGSAWNGPGFRDVGPLVGHVAKGFVEGAAKKNGRSDRRKTPGNSSLRNFASVI